MLLWRVQGIVLTWTILTLASPVMLGANTCSHSVLSTHISCELLLVASARVHVMSSPHVLRALCGSHSAIGVLVRSLHALPSHGLLRIATHHRRLLLPHGMHSCAILGCHMASTIGPIVHLLVSWLRVAWVHLAIRCHLAGAWCTASHWVGHHQGGDQVLGGCPVAR